MMIHKLQEDQSPLQYTFTYEELNIIENVQELWLYYAMWLRSLLMARIFNLPNLEVIQGKIYETPLYFYNTLRVFYGSRIAQQFLNYLQRRIIIEGNIVEFMIEGNQEQLDYYIQEYYRNADEIAAFLAQFPYWDESTWRAYLYQDINLFLEEVRSLLVGDYEREVAIFESIIRNASDIGRYMAAGIIASP